MSTDKKRINAWISSKNYDALEDFVKTNEVVTTKLSKGSVLDIALSNLFSTLETESLENLIVNHFKRS